MSLDTLGGAWASLGGSWGVLCGPWEVLGGSRGRSPNSFVMYTIGNSDVSEGSLGARKFAKGQQWIRYGSATEQQEAYHTGGLGPP